MDLDKVSVDYFQSVCESSGVHCHGTTKLRNRVYRTTVISPDGNKQEFFGKIYPSAKTERIRRLVEHAGAIGLPEAQIVSNDIVILLLEPADGQPLSYILPVFLLPGVWGKLGHRIESAYSHLGWYLGTQHAQTASNRVELLDQAKRSELQRRADLVKHDVPELTDTRIAELLNEARKRTVSEAVTHSDPSPHNIFYKAGDVTLIDNAFSRKVAAQDHANALLGSWLMIDRLHYPADRAGHQIEKAYWKGYNSRGIWDSVDRLSVGILMIKKYLALSEYYRSDLDTLHARITRYLDRPAIVRGIRRELRYLVEAGICDG